VVTGDSGYRVICGDLEIPSDPNLAVRLVAEALGVTPLVATYALSILDNAYEKQLEFVMLVSGQNREALESQFRAYLRSIYGAEVESIPLDIQQRLCDKLRQSGKLRQVAVLRHIVMVVEGLSLMISRKQDGIVAKAKAKLNVLDADPPIGFSNGITLTLTLDSTEPTEHVASITVIGRDNDTLRHLYHELLSNIAQLMNVRITEETRAIVINLDTPVELDQEVAEKLVYTILATTQTMCIRSRAREETIAETLEEGEVNELISRLATPLPVIVTPRNVYVLYRHLVTHMQKYVKNRASLLNLDKILSRVTETVMVDGHMAKLVKLRRDRIDLNKICSTIIGAPRRNIREAIVKALKTAGIDLESADSFTTQEN